MAKIFVSYRREDTLDFAGRLCERLRRKFGDASVFLAPDDIPLGQPFDRVLEDQLRRCRVLLAVIGRQWLAESNPAGSPSPGQYVEFEVAAALERGIPTVPIRVDGAPVPTNLPGRLAGLPGRQWLRIDRDNFPSGADLLVEQIEKNYVMSLVKRRMLVGAQVLLVAVGATLLLSAPLAWTQTLPAVFAFGLAAVLSYSPTWGWQWRA